MTLQRHALIRGIESMHALFRVSFLVTLQVHALFCDEWSAYSPMASIYSVWTLDQMPWPTNGISTTHKTFHDNTCPASMWMALGVGIWMNNIGVYVEYKWAGVGIPSHICSHAPTTSKPVTLHTWAMIGDDHDSTLICQLHELFHSGKHNTTSS